MRVEAGGAALLCQRENGTQDNIVLKHHLLLGEVSAGAGGGAPRSVSVTSSVTKYLFSAVSCKDQKRSPRSINTETIMVQRRRFPRLL